MAETHMPIVFVFEAVEQNNVSNLDPKCRYLTVVGGGVRRDGTHSCDKCKAHTCTNMQMVTRTQFLYIN